LYSVDWSKCSGNDNDFVVLPVIPSSRFISFPTSVHAGNGWNGSYTAIVSVVLEDGSNHHLGNLKWVCFNDELEWDTHRYDLDEFELTAWATSNGFLGCGRGYLEGMWVGIPEAGVPSTIFDSWAGGSVGAGGSSAAAAAAASSPAGYGGGGYGDAGGGAGYGAAAMWGGGGGMGVMGGYGQQPAAAGGGSAGAGGSSAKLEMGIERVPTYLPIVDFISTFNPTKRCSDYILQDAAQVLTDVLHLDRVVAESGKIASSKLDAGVAQTLSLAPQEFLAVVVWTFDLSLLVVSTPEVAKKNFFYQLNTALQSRDAAKIDGRRGYLHFLMSGLAKLPAATCTVFRGIKRESFPVLDQHYTSGRKVHWSGFSSTSSSFDVARTFAGHEGVVLRISVQSGCILNECSAIPTEKEVLLLPNFQALVTKGIHTDESSGVRCIELCEITDAPSHVF
jgi:hypothetical protein